MKMKSIMSVFVLLFVSVTMFAQTEWTSIDGKTKVVVEDGIMVKVYNADTLYQIVDLTTKLKRRGGISCFGSTITLPALGDNEFYLMTSPEAKTVGSEIALTDASLSGKKITIIKMGKDASGNDVVKSTLNYEVSAKEAVKGTASDGTVINNGSRIVVYINSTVFASDYTWNVSGITPFAAKNADGGTGNEEPGAEYKVTLSGTLANGCPAEDIEVTIKNAGPPTYTIGETVICGGATMTLSEVVRVTGGHVLVDEVVENTNTSEKKVTYKFKLVDDLYNRTWEKPEYEVEVTYLETVNPRVDWTEPLDTVCIYDTLKVPVKVSEHANYSWSYINQHVVDVAGDFMSIATMTSDVNSNCSQNYSRTDYCDIYPEYVFESDTSYVCGDVDADGMKVVLGGQLLNKEYLLEFGVSPLFSSRDSIGEDFPQIYTFENIHHCRQSGKNIAQIANFPILVGGIKDRGVEHFYVTDEFFDESDIKIQWGMAGSTGYWSWKDTINGTINGTGDIIYDVPVGYHDVVIFEESKYPACAVIEAPIIPVAVFRKNSEFTLNPYQNGDVLNIEINYPNELEGGVGEYFHVKIYKVSGVFAKEKSRVEANGVSTIADFSTADLNAGTYLVKVTGKIYWQKNSMGIWVKRNSLCSYIKTEQFTIIK